MHAATSYLCKGGNTGKKSLKIVVLQVRIAKYEICIFTFSIVHISQLFLKRMEFYLMKIFSKLFWLYLSL